ncbi:hypothetical protein CCDG5_1070 [[Clostridium] cellulosi]|uniref:Uncharacterized protein n=1 Tax=[Clostridium] cellulosi TaxID=29343 RepID=A0A078KNS0_9FIRM|nr:hypothetical protein CCDG5_1070 [[Clostridium] cellulosi]
MLKKTTFKLSLSILGSFVVGFILSFFIIISLAPLGATPSSKSSSAPTSSSSNSVSYFENEATEGGLVATTGGRIFLAAIAMLITEGAIYSSAWREGNRDPNRVKYGHMKKFMAKGFVAGLLSIIPNVILTILVLATADLNNIFSNVVNVIYHIVNIQFIILGDGYMKIPIACFAVLLIIPLFSGLGYISGWYHFAILPKLIYKKNKPAPKSQSKKNM